MSTSMDKITLIIPEGVTRVIEDIWSDIEKIEIPNSVVNIGEWAFSGCESLTDIAIPNSVMSIGDYAFRRCLSLTEIIIPNSVLNIGEHAFYGCSKLTSIVIPDSVVYIGDYAFRDCESLTEITIPESVTFINGVFCGCYSLKSIYIDKDRDSLDLSRADLPKNCKIYWKGDF